jgi:hypothetical protein
MGIKTVFDKAKRDELIGRINLLNENSTPLWGKMTVYQLMKHCRLWEEMVLGKKQYKQIFIGRLFGKMALKNVLKNEQLLGRNSPTMPGMVIKESGDVAAEKEQRIKTVKAYADFANPNFVHPFLEK